MALSGIRKLTKIVNPLNLHQSSFPRCYNFSSRVMTPNRRITSSQYYIHPRHNTSNLHGHFKSKCFLHTSSSSVLQSKASYEADGKTTVTILNTETGAPLMIDTYSETGFRLNNGMWVVGPMAVFPKTVLAFDVANAGDVTPEALSLFTLLEPKPDVLIIGVGDSGKQLPLETLQYLKKMKINTEILATVHACTTFNFLSGEGRCAAALLIPPTHIAWTQMDAANSKLKRRKIYDDDEDEGKDAGPFSSTIGSTWKKFLDKRKENKPTDNADTKDKEK